MSIDLPTSIVATFAPDHTVHMTTGDNGPCVFLVDTGRTIVTFDTIAGAIELCLHNCGWGDHTVAAVES